MDLIKEFPLSESSFIESTSSAFALASSYVLSLYIWNTNLDRDHPKTIKRRFISVLTTLFIAPIFVYVFADKTLRNYYSLTRILGIHTDSLLTAIILPLLLTCILFSGPLAINIFTKRYVYLIYPDYWLDNFRSLIWWRNYVVAPFTEEFVYRACMLPILLSYYNRNQSILISPLFFGVAHLHHLHERIRQGHEFKTAILMSLFQMTYTTIFGIYSAFLFVRTGHLIAPVLVHSFCNFMGFPDLSELSHFQSNTRNILLALHVIGLLLFLFLLFPATNPNFFANNVYY